MRSSAIARFAIVVSVALLANACSSSTKTNREAVAERGVQVMPFDLEKTTHTFTKTADGGLQTVVADDPGDTEQILFIRTHLASEAEKFSRGDYSDPAQIHGMDMPGIAELAKGANRVEVIVADLPDGGTITYRSTEPALIDALHQWFERQTADHG